MSENPRSVDFAVGSWTLGFERSTVRLGGEPYLTRYILKLFGRTLRLHKFHRGDDDRAFHNHPWAFWTFPLSTYWEWVPGKNGTRRSQLVRCWRLHYRPAEYQHIVEAPLGHHNRPFWTIVFTGKYEQSWGFFPSPGVFVPWREWK